MYICIYILLYTYNVLILYILYIAYIIQGAKCRSTIAIRSAPRQKAAGLSCVFVKRRGRGERRKEREDRKRETTSPFIRRPAAAHTVPGPPGLQRLRQQFSRDFMNLVCKTVA
jgi:hypothetical protein